MMCQLAPSERSNLLSGRNGVSCQKNYVGTHIFSASNNNNSSTKKHNGWYVILFGQTIALSLSCANAASSTLENEYQIRVPTFQTGLVYLLLSFHLFWRWCRIKNDGMSESIPMNDEGGQSEGVLHHLSIDDGDSNATIDRRTPQQSSYTVPFTSLPLHTPWHVYLILAILDVEANYLAMLSFQHTSLSSSMLLTSLSVLSTVLLRRLVFQSSTYTTKQHLGIYLCLVGGCLWLRNEFDHGDKGADFGDFANGPTQQSQSYVLYGDLLALSAAFLYGLNDVLAEYFVKTNNDSVEYLGMLGLFGSIFSFIIQVPLVERQSVQQLVARFGVSSDDSMGAMFLLLCFIAMLSYFYISVMSFLSVNDSTILNLSLQTCPLWAVVLTMVQKSMSGEGSGWVAIPPITFFVSLTMVIVGMFLYEKYSENERNESNVGKMDDGSSSDGMELDRDDDYNNCCS